MWNKQIIIIEWFGKLYLLKLKASPKTKAPSSPKISMFTVFNNTNDVTTFFSSEPDKKNYIIFSLATTIKSKIININTIGSHSFFSGHQYLIIKFDMCVMMIQKKKWKEKHILEWFKYDYEHLDI